MRLTLIAALCAWGTVGHAEVSRANLAPLQTDFVRGTLHEYHHDGFTHSVFIEAGTDYGDTLPYLFTCPAPSVQCVMALEGDDYRYLLDRGETTVTIVTQSTTDDFTVINVFEVIE